MGPSSAYHLIHNELQTQGNPTLNVASFVTTIMDEECDRLTGENLGVNYIDTEVYRANLEIQNGASPSSMACAMRPRRRSPGAMRLYPAPCVGPAMSRK